MDMMLTRRDLCRSGTALAAAGLSAPADAGRTRLADGIDSFTAQLEAARVAAKVTGASFAYWDGKQLHTAVSGMRNSVTADPVTPDTLMHVGSITKIANTALLMQLVDEGKIALEDPLLKHLPDFRLRDMAAAKHISCGMLVNHSSGIDGSWLPEYGPDQERIVDTIERCATLGQLFPPGQETSYNNVATVISGYLVQRLRGKSWYTLVKTMLYEPLDMRHALVDPLEAPRFRVSVGDLTNAATGQRVQTTRPFLAASFAPAGSTQMTSAADTVTLARALIGGGIGSNGRRILTAASASRMMQESAAFVPIGGWGEKVGLGWMILPGGVLSHGGSGPGVRSKVYAHPASGRVAVLLTNSDKGNNLISAFLDPIVEAWTGIKVGEPSIDSQPVDPRPIDAGRYIGVYEDVADRYAVTQDAGGLFLRTDDKFLTYDNSSTQSPPIRLESIGNDSFKGRASTAAAADRLIRFIRPDGDGKMRFLSSWGRLMARTD
ncbi:serine hydrolase domain-containing protein [Sphingomonas sp. LT1P40]|uniref:serine hydrolase domain-containing protein n=1 Tax=Alteristakelama amylovorans TaxID=3096166 RepID=UPI002FC93DDA